LDYKRGVPLARPQVEAGNIALKERRKCGMTEAGFSPCAWNCQMRQMGLSGAVGNWASAGTPLLDYKGCVPVAQPRER
jgi:hypothetical protein